MSGSEKSSGMTACTALAAPEPSVESAEETALNAPVTAAEASQIDRIVVSAHTVTPWSAAPMVCSSPARRPAT